MAHSVSEVTAEYWYLNKSETLSKDAERDYSQVHTPAMLKQGTNLNMIQNCCHILRPGLG